MSRKSWGYIRHNDKTLYDITTGAIISSKELAGIVLNRWDYTLDILTLPKGTDEEIYKILQYKIRELHPAPTETLFDWIVIQKGKIQTLAVVIISREYHETLKERFPETPLTILLQWFDFKNSGNDEYPYVWKGGGEQESYSIREGLLQPSRSDTMNGQSFPLKKDPPRPLFRKRKRSFLKEGPGLNILLTAVALLSIIAFMSIRLSGLKTTAETLKADYSVLLAEKSRILELQNEIMELNTKKSQNQALNHGNLTHSLAELISLIPSGTIIDQLETDQSGFRIRLRSNQPLIIIKLFNESGKYRNLESSIIKKIQGSNKSAFTLTGDFNG